MNMGNLNEGALYKMNVGTLNSGALYKMSGDLEELALYRCLSGPADVPLYHYKVPVSSW